MSMGAPQNFFYGVLVLCFGFYQNLGVPVLYLAFWCAFSKGWRSEWNELKLKEKGKKGGYEKIVGEQSKLHFNC